MAKLCYFNQGKPRFSAELAANELYMVHWEERVVPKLSRLTPYWKSTVNSSRNLIQRLIFLITP